MTERPSRRGRLNEGRPRLGEEESVRITVKLPGELNRAFRREAQARHLTPSAALRGLVERFVKKEI